MARRIKSKKRKYLGQRTFGAGNTKNRRGKGSRGGVGRAGFHKHKWFHTIKYEGTTRTEPGFENPTRREYNEVKLEKIVEEIERGIHKADQSGTYNIDLTKKNKLIKLLGNGKFSFKAKIKADAFSKSAEEKIKRSNGTITSNDQQKN